QRNSKGQTSTDSGHLESSSEAEPKVHGCSKEPPEIEPQSAKRPPHPDPRLQKNGRGSVRNGARAKSYSPATVSFPVVEPWPEPVNGAQLLDALLQELLRFVVFPKWAAVTFALWILHTFAFRLRDLTTYIGIE